VPAAIRAAKIFVTGAIEAALALGGGHGPVNPMHRQEAAKRPEVPR
jgi:hydroxymethylpyrimidine/phosphomethylpyrimidine kinase